MAKFIINEANEHAEHFEPRTKDELDAKHAAGLDAKSIISWKAPSRVFKARSRNYFVKVATMAFILILAAIFFGEFALVGVIIALVFVVYVFASIAPETIEHRITNMGIVSGGRAFLWDELDSFWFDKKGDDRVLVIETYLQFPSRLILLLTTVSERGLLDLLEKHLHYHHHPVRSLFDKWAIWLQDRISLE